MKNFKKGYLLIGHEISLSKKDCPITSEERECCPAMQPKRRGVNWVFKKLNINLEL